MTIRLTGTSSSDYKTLYPPINLGEKSGYNEIGLRRIENTYVNMTISNIFRGVNDRLWFKFSLGDVGNPQYIEIDFGKEANGTPKTSGTYDTNKIVLALNAALALKKKDPPLNRDGTPGTGAPTPALYNGRAGNGIRFSVDTDDKIVMQVAGDSVVFLGANSFIEKKPEFYSIGDTLGFNSNEQGTFDRDMVGGTRYGAVEKAMYFAGTYKAWNKIIQPDNTGVKWISVDCDLVDKKLNYIEIRKGFLDQSKSLYVIDTDDIAPGQKVDLHIPNVMYLPTRGDISQLGGIEVILTDQNRNKLNTITDIVFTIVIRKSKTSIEDSIEKSKTSIVESIEKSKTSIVESIEKSKTNIGNED